MKRSTKIGLGAVAVFFATTFLAGCTASYCTVNDKAHMLYMFDPGVTVYTSEATRVVGEETIENDALVIDGVTISGLYRYTDVEGNKYLNEIKATTDKAGIRFPSNDYWAAVDQIVLDRAFAASNKKVESITTVEDITTMKEPELYKAGTRGFLDEYGYLKYGDDSAKDQVLWTNWTAINDVLYVDASLNGSAKYNVYLDEMPTTDFVTQYQKSMNNYIAGFRSCLAVEENYYGTYGEKDLPIKIEAKKWTDWNGLLEFLFVWPIGAFIDVLTSGMIGNGVANGVAQLFAILIVTVVVRSIMLLVSFRSTRSTAKMNELQPEIAKIQAKYPNSNTNNYERQKMAQEMQRLYKKNGVNPLSSLLIMIIQFPVFICVWGALQGSAWLSTGSFLGLNLSSSISSVIFSSTGWKTGGAATALVLFLLMSITQAIAMLLPQWIQKKKAKDVAKLGRNPAQKSQNNKMKWFTYIMLIMIIIMGFSLASAMGVYWFVGALFSIAQTLIFEAINARKAKRSNK